MPVANPYLKRKTAVSIPLGAGRPAATTTLNGNRTIPGASASAKPKSVPLPLKSSPQNSLTERTRPPRVTPPSKLATKKNNGNNHTGGRQLSPIAKGKEVTAQNHQPRPVPMQTQTQTPPSRLISSRPAVVSTTKTNTKMFVPAAPVKKATAKTQTQKSFKAQLKHEIAQLKRAKLMEKRRIIYEAEQKIRQAEKEKERIQKEKETLARLKEMEAKRILQEKQRKEAIIRIQKEKELKLVLQQQQLEKKRLRQHQAYQKVMAQEMERRRQNALLQPTTLPSSSNISTNSAGGDGGRSSSGKTPTYMSGTNYPHAGATTAYTGTPVPLAATTPSYKGVGTYDPPRFHPSGGETATASTESVPYSSPVPQLSSSSFKPLLFANDTPATTNVKMDIGVSPPMNVSLVSSNRNDRLVALPPVGSHNVKTSLPPQGGCKNVDNTEIQIIMEDMLSILVGDSNGLQLLTPQQQYQQKLQQQMLPAQYNHRSSLPFPMQNINDPTTLPITATLHQQQQQQWLARGTSTHPHAFHSWSKNSPLFHPSQAYAYLNQRHQAGFLETNHPLAGAPMMPPVPSGHLYPSHKRVGALIPVPLPTSSTCTAIPKSLLPQSAVSKRKRMPAVLIKPKILALHKEPMQSPSPYVKSHVLFVENIVILKPKGGSFGVNIKFETKSTLVDPPPLPPPKAVVLPTDSRLHTSIIHYDNANVTTTGVTKKDEFNQLVDPAAKEVSGPNTTAKSTGTCVSSDVETAKDTTPVNPENATISKEFVNNDLPCKHSNGNRSATACLKGISTDAKQTLEPSFFQTGINSFKATTAEDTGSFPLASTGLETSSLSNVTKMGMLCRLDDIAIPPDVTIIPDTKNKKMSDPILRVPLDPKSASLPSVVCADATKAEDTNTRQKSYQMNDADSRTVLPSSATTKTIAPTAIVLENTGNDKDGSARTTPFTTSITTASDNVDIPFSKTLPITSDLNQPKNNSTITGIGQPPIMLTQQPQPAGTPVPAAAVPAAASAVSRHRRRRRKRVFFGALTVVDAEKQYSENKGSGDAAIKLQSGDLILKINGSSICGMMFQQACALFAACNTPLEVRKGSNAVQKDTEASNAPNDPSASISNGDVLGTDVTEYIQCSLTVARLKPKPVVFNIRNEVSGIPKPIVAAANSPLQLHIPARLPMIDFTINTTNQRVITGDFSKDELAGLLEAMIKRLNHPNRVLGFSASSSIASLCFQGALPLVRREYSTLRRKWFHITSMLDLVAESASKKQWIDLWKTESSGKDYYLNLKFDFLSNAQRSAMRALPRPSKGCKCGNLNHSHVHHPECTLYGNIRYLQEEKIKASNKEDIKKNVLIKPLNAMETAVIKAELRKKSEREAEEDEAHFVQEMEKLQLKELQVAIFAPSLTAMVLSAIASLSEQDCEYAEIDSENEKERNEQGNERRSVHHIDDNSGDDSSEDDDMPLVALAPASKKRKLDFSKGGKTFNMNFLSKILQLISRTWGHVFREPSHLDYAWRWEIFRGQTGDGALDTEAFSKNPRKPDSLSYENAQFALNDKVFPRRMRFMSSAPGSTFDANSKLHTEPAILVNTSINYSKIGERKSSVNNIEIGQVNETETTDLMLMSHLISPEKSGLYDELVALVRSGVLLVDDRGSAVLNGDDWYSKVDALLLNEMYNQWSPSVDNGNKFCINDSIRKTLATHWERVDEPDGWALADDPFCVVHQEEEYEEWRRSFENTNQAHDDDVEGIGKFGF